LPFFIILKIGTAIKHNPPNIRPKGKTGIFPFPNVSGSGVGFGVVSGSIRMPKTADSVAGKSVGDGVFVGVGLGVLVGGGTTVGVTVTAGWSNLFKTGFTSKFSPAEKLWVSSQLRYPDFLKLIV
jgi:hypothetical protein